MGIVEAIVAAAVITTASTVYSAQSAKRSAKKQQRALERQASEQKEANAISQAQAKSADRRQRRQAIREERVKRAQILSQAEGSGVGGSSGAIGAQSVLSTSLNEASAAASQNTLASRGIAAANQRSADAGLEAALAANKGAYTRSLVGGLSGVVSQGIKMGIGSGLFGSTSSGPSGLIQSPGINVGTTVLPPGTSPRATY